MSTVVDRRGVLGGAAALAAEALPIGRLHANERAYTCSIALTEGRIWLAAGIGANGPYLFIVDTGGVVSLIDNDLARALKLKQLPVSRRLVGIGGVSDYPWYDAGEVRFGSGIRIPHMLFAGTGSRIGKDARGTFGAGLFTTFDSDLDFVKGEWRAFPGRRAMRDGMIQLKSRFTGNDDSGARIFADASVGDYAGDFLIDTGAPGEISLDSHASAKSGLWNDARPYAPIVARGIGRGRVPSRLVRVDRMKIGPFVFEQPIVKLNKPGTPTHAGDGIIGLATLARLHLATQVSTRTVWAMPNGRAAPRNAYPLSGIYVDEDKGRMTIAEVGTGSPAAGAGLRPGDAIVGTAFWPLMRLLDGPPGTVVPLAIERAGKRQDVTLKLVPFL